MFALTHLIEVANAKVNQFLSIFVLRGAYGWSTVSRWVLYFYHSGRWALMFTKENTLFSSMEQGPLFLLMFATFYRFFFNFTLFLPF